MVDSKESFHESVIMKRAKRRLIGAIAILIILFTLSLFFVKNAGQTEVQKKEIKVSFLEMGPASFNSQKKINKIETFKYSTNEFEKKTNSVKKEKNFTVQIGIFSDNFKTQQLSNQINNIGFKTQIKKITLSGQEKIKLTTEFFESEKDAQKALQKLKNSNFPGLIKRQ
ncbi:SPOR domain-containing protein [Methylophilaceae bacterium]|nr:SPOR domain-containing protein [Methylophilaceae bacterium]|tara:strand:- start:3634 stop:4140 length:507 start_codon:yes stop_codon:yes gene_type:complete